MFNDYGKFITANGQCNSPDELGHIYVVDRGNNRIEKLDSNGTFITAWGSLVDGQFSEVAGHVYVLDYGDNAVKVFGLGAI